VGDKYPTNSNKKDLLVCSHLAYELPSKTRYLRKYGGNDRSEGKARKKTYEATG